MKLASKKQMLIGNNKILVKSMFKDKGKSTKFRIYEDITEIERHIRIPVNVAEELNKVIAVFNKENKFLKIDNSILIVSIINTYFKQADGLPEDKQLEEIKQKVVETYGI